MIDLNALAHPVDYTIYKGQDLTPPRWLYDYLLAKSGLYKRAESDHFSACVPVGQRFDLPGLQDVSPSFHLNHPRVRLSTIQAALNDARRSSVGGFVETFYLFHWKRDRWRVHRPPQRNHRASVQYATDFSYPEYQQSIVMELHTHPGEAFFSAVDDADETGLRLYAVLGHIHRERPQVVLRVGVYGDSWVIPLDAVFEKTVYGSFEEVHHDYR